MDKFRKLEEIFSNFPGIGPRQAKRFVFYIMGRPESFVNEFSALLKEVKESMSLCARCHRLFLNKASNQTCSICNDKNRDHTTIMIVSRDSDLENIEKIGAYNGTYFVLGGSVPILDKEPEKRIRLKMLLNIVQSHIDIREIILSLNATADGEHTAHIVREALSRLDNFSKFKITVLGKGISTGAELEYVDSETLKNALKNRF